MQGFFYRYIRLYRPLINKLNDLLGEFDLTYSLWQVIFYVKNFGPCTLVEISKYYQVEKPNITRTVRRLEEKGLLKQIPGKDRREKIIQLTEKGEDIYRNCREKITALEFQVMEGIPEEDQRTIFEMLPKLREKLTKQKGE